MIPNLTVVWVIALVLLLAWLLNRLLFTPVTKVIRERELAVTSARELAQTAAAQAQAAAAEFDSKTKAARAEIYREMDERRRAALNARAEILAKSRQEAEAAIAEASTRLKAETRDARARLAEEADQLANVVIERVLGRKAS